MQDVVVENRQTGERKEMTKVMATILSKKYRIVPETNGKSLFKSHDFKAPGEVKTGLEKLRLEYFELFGQQPHHRLGAVKLAQLIEEERNKK